MKRIIAMGACAAAAGAVLTGLLFWFHSRRADNGIWNRQAIRARLERVVSMHNDASFVYVLENRTISDYRIEDESEVQIVGRSRSTGALVAGVNKHVSGEFPLLLPAGRSSHFALVWTADRDIDADHTGDFVKSLDIQSFTVLDKLRGYEIDFPAP